MKKYKLTVVVSVVLIVFSGIMSGSCYEYMYSGVEFYSSMYSYILNGIIFICFVLIEKNTPLSSFSRNNLAKLVRIHSRRKALMCEIVRIFVTMLLLEICEILSVLAGSFLYGRKIIFLALIQYFIMNYIIKLFLILVQFLLEMSVAYNFAFLIVYAIFLCGLYSGQSLHERMLEVQDIDKCKMYEMINRFNIANYTSLPRINELTGSAFIPAVVVVGLIFLTVGVLFVYIKRADLSVC